MKRYQILVFGVMAVLGAAFFNVLPVSAEEAVKKGGDIGKAVKEFTVVAVDYKGTKFWIPSTLIVSKGDKVKINLINKVDTGANTHGYAIDAFNIKELVQFDKPSSVDFFADKVGVFTIYCHQHPAHIGGQLLVLENK